jgi:hypothetical protein
MKVWELKEALEKMPPQNNVVLYGNEWGDYEDVTMVRAIKVDIHQHKQETNIDNSMLYPAGEQLHYGYKLIGHKQYVLIGREGQGYSE